jgi:hypothetical protein
LLVSLPVFKFLRKVTSNRAADIGKDRLQGGKRGSGLEISDFGAYCMTMRVITIFSSRGVTNVVNDTAFAQFSLWYKQCVHRSTTCVRVRSIKSG